MGYEEPRTFVSAADLSDKQFYLAELDADGKVSLANAATDILIGTIVDGGTASGDQVAIRLSGGTHRVILGGSVNEGARLTSDANGKAVVTTTEDDAVFGQAIEAGAANDIIELVSPGTYLVPPA